MIYCYHCMAQIEDPSQQYCPKCGKLFDVHYSENYELPAGTYLNEGRYLVGRSIGTGGFGITYVGRDLKLDKKVVIKETFYSGVFHRDCSKPDDINDPFAVQFDIDEVSIEEIAYKTQKECLSLSKGERYSNIVKVYDYLFENKTSYIITEYINGKTLHDRIVAIGHYTWNDLYEKMKPLMLCLASLHREGLLHRDIKPQNIMIRRIHERMEEFVLIDFGLARTAQSFIVDSAFTPGFSPPEQKTAEETDGTYTDVYSLAATIYNALTGEIPPEATSNDVHINFPQLNYLRQSNYVPPNVVSALEYALNPDYTRRCKTIDGFMYQLEDMSINVSPVLQYPNGFDMNMPNMQLPNPPMQQNNQMYPNPPMQQNNQVYQNAPQQYMDPNVYNNAQNIMPEVPYDQANFAQAQGNNFNRQNYNSSGYANVYIPKQNMPEPNPSDVFPLSITTKTQSIAINFLYIMGIKLNGEIITSGGVRMYPFAQISRDKIELGKQLDEIKKELKSDANALKEWNNIISISMGNFHTLSRHTVGLVSDGTVRAVGSNAYGECNTKDWQNVLAIYTGENYTMGLRANGTVYATGDNLKGQCNVGDWRNVVSIAAGPSHAIGLRADGTTIASGDNSYGQCMVNTWSDIIAVDTSRRHTIGLRADGIPIFAGDNSQGQGDINTWRDICAISVSPAHTVGLLSTGKVRAVGNNKDGQCNVKNWRNITAISASPDHTVGLRADGTVVAAGNNEHGQCNVEEWDNVMEIYTYYRMTVGLKWNGTVVATGFNDYGQCNVKSWKNIKFPRTTNL